MLRKAKVYELLDQDVVEHLLDHGILLFVLFKIVLFFI